MKNRLNALKNTASKIVLGRPVDRHWVLWEQSCGLAGHSEVFYLCRAIGEVFDDDKDWFPAPSKLGPCCGIFRVSYSNSDESVISWSRSHSTDLDALPMAQLVSQYPWVGDVIKEVSNERI